MFPHPPKDEKKQEKKKKNRSILDCRGSLDQNRRNFDVVFAILLTAMFVDYE